MADFINTIDALGDDAVIDSIIQRTITEFKDNRVKQVGAYGFYISTALKMVDLPNLNNLDQCAFGGCSALKAVILRKSAAVVTLAHANTFHNSAISSGTGYVYVPRALLDSYKAATNWSTYTDQFRALEDYTVDATITGELDESKI